MSLTIWDEIGETEEMVNCQQGDDFIQVADHALFRVSIDLVVDREHHVSLIEVHQNHQLGPGVDVDVHDDNSYDESSGKVEENEGQNGPSL